MTLVTRHSTLIVVSLAQQLLPSSVLALGLPARLAFGLLAGVSSDSVSQVSQPSVWVQASVAMHETLGCRHMRGGGLVGQTKLFACGAVVLNTPNIF